MLSRAAPHFSEWTNLRKLYNAGITKGQLKLLRRHSNILFQGKQRGSIHSEIKHGGHDCNGFSLDPSKIQLPNETKLWSVNSMKDFDEHFTSRVMGFESAMDMYRWTSCSELMYQIRDLPMLFVNTKDDPLVPEHLHSIPKKYTGKFIVMVCPEVKARQIAGRAPVYICEAFCSPCPSPPLPLPFLLLLPLLPSPSSSPYPSSPLPPTRTQS